MSEEQSSSGTDGTAGARAGERLAEARRGKDISIAEVAKELHLDEAKVEALERNQFDALGAAVFAKGHLRKYADYVGVPADEVLADYDDLNRSAGAPQVVPPPRRRDVDLSRYILPGAVLLLILIAVLWWIGGGGPETPQGRSSDAPTGAGTVAEAPARDAVAAGDDAATDSGDDAAPTMDDAAAPAEFAEDDDAAEPEESSVAEQAAPEATVAAEPPAEAASPQIDLAMRFSGDCWTEVTDAAGSRLYFDLGRAGRSVDVSGTPPLRVLFGNVDNVSLQVDGEPYPIPASARRGETARFTINTP